MGVESVLRRHAPAHDGIEEGLPLASVEPQDLVIRRQTENGVDITDREDVRFKVTKSELHNRKTARTEQLDKPPHSGGTICRNIYFLRRSRSLTYTLKQAGVL